MFQLTKEELESLRCQIGTFNSVDAAHTLPETGSPRCQSGTLKATKYLPYAFTEQGVAMLSSVLHSDTAIDVNVKIMRAFVAIRQALPMMTTRADIEDLKSRVRTLEAIATGTMEQVGDLRTEVAAIYDALNRMQELPPAEPLPPVGYQATLDRQKKNRLKLNN